MWLDVTQVKTPWFFAIILFQKLHRSAGHVGRLGFFIRHPRRAGRDIVEKARTHLAVTINGVGSPVPRVLVIVIAALFEVFVIRHIRLQDSVRMNTVIAFIGLKSDLRMMHAKRTRWVNTKTLHPFLIGDHVGLAYKNWTHSQRLEMIANVTFPHA